MTKKPVNLTNQELVTNYDAAVVLVNATAKTQNVAVPAGKRWFLQGGLATNGDDVNRTLTISITNGTNIIGYIQQATTLNAGATVVYPNTLADANHLIFPPGGFPMDPTWQIRFVWATGGASTGGNSTITAIVYQTTYV